MEYSITTARSCCTKHFHCCCRNLLRQSKEWIQYIHSIGCMELGACLQFKVSDAVKEQFYGKLTVCKR